MALTMEETLKHISWHIKRRQAVYIDERRGGQRENMGKESGVMENVWLSMSGDHGAGEHHGLDNIIKHMATLGKHFMVS